MATGMTPASLRLTVTKVSHNAAELAALDARRGHYSRAAFLRAAGQDAQLQAAPGAELATTLAESARIQSCFHHINKHAKELNSIASGDGPEAAARELLACSGQILADFTEFRVAVFGGAEV